MSAVKITLKWLIILTSPLAIYLIAALILSNISLNQPENQAGKTQQIYLSTNGVHLDIIFNLNDLDSSDQLGIQLDQGVKYLAFGWGDENFYLNTPTWGDLSIKTAFNAMFMNSSTLMHVSRYAGIKNDWVEIKISPEELSRLRSYIIQNFKTNEQGLKMLLPNQGYYAHDDFYRAKGSYSCIHTCNSWVNTGFKESGLKCCVWTPFDFGLLNQYKK